MCGFPTLGSGSGVLDFPEALLEHELKYMMPRTSMVLNILLIIILLRLCIFFYSFGPLLYITGYWQRCACTFYHNFIVDSLNTLFRFHILSKIKERKHT